MLNRKHAVLALAVCATSAAAGMARAADATPSMTLEPRVVNLQDASSRTLLMGGLDKIGAAKGLDALGITITGWVESGYTYNMRHNSVSGSQPLGPFTDSFPFNHEVGNHYMLNQVDLQFARAVDTKKLDVGGLIELMYGSDANAIHSRGLGYNGNDSSADNIPEAPDDRYDPKYQFDIVQAYVDIGVGVEALKLRVGKFITPVGYEVIAAGGNPFYSHSYLFTFEPLTHTGVMAYYTLNDQWAFAAGVSRGWDTATEDNGGPISTGGNGNSVDFLGQATWTPNKQWAVILNTTVGPEDANETAHYRTLINPVATYKVNDKLTLAGEGLYIYDGGFNTSFTSSTTGHGYGDAWGLALYASYAIDDMWTLNGRIEKAHDFRSGTTLNYYEATLGVSITPFPKDWIGKNLKIRPEVRYDWSEDEVFPVGNNNSFQDQVTFGADVIFSF